jgi:hypothetical protein
VHGRPGPRRAHENGLRRVALALGAAIVAGIATFLAIELWLEQDIRVGGFTIGYMSIASVGAAVFVFFLILRERPVVLGLLAGVATWAAVTLVLGTYWLGMISEGITLFGSIAVGVGVMLGLYEAGARPRAKEAEAQEDAVSGHSPWIGAELPRVLRPVAFGAVAGVLGGTGIAVLLQSLPTEHEERFWIGGILFALTILVSVAVGALALPFAMLSGSTGALGVAACAICLPVSMWLVSDYLWEQELARAQGNAWSSAWDGRAAGR